MANYVRKDFDDLEVVDCPCGYAQRAFTDVEAAPVSVHLVEITAEAKVHYHKKLTETYMILDGDGYIECDGHIVPVKPMVAVLIKPGCRHRAVGRMRIINICSPPFDPQDEYFD